LGWLEKFVREVTSEGRPNRWAGYSTIFVKTCQPLPPDYVAKKQIERTVGCYVHQRTTAPLAIHINLVSTIVPSQGRGAPLGRTFADART